MQDSTYQAGSLQEVARSAPPTNGAQCTTKPLPLACPPTITVIRPEESVVAASRYVCNGSSRMASVSDGSPQPLAVHLKWQS